MRKSWLQSDPDPELDKMFTYIEVFQSKDLQFLLPDKFLKLFEMHEKATLLEYKR